jgi:hypothetical protein
MILADHILTPDKPMGISPYFAIMHLVNMILILCVINTMIRWNRRFEHEITEMKTQLIVALGNAAALERGNQGLRGEQGKQGSQGEQVVQGEPGTSE